MRVVNDQKHSTKRDEILSTALELIYSQGYEKMSIQDILNARHMSKGAFYHYFNSKQALLVTLVDQMREKSLQLFQPIVDDSSRTALQKLERYFEVSAQWKLNNKMFTVSAMRLWYTDNNSLFRQKVTADSLKYTAALLEPIIRQGTQEQAFDVAYPKQAARIISGMSLSLADELCNSMLSSEKPTISELEFTLKAYANAIERILGVLPGTIKVFDEGMARKLVVALAAD